MSAVELARRLRVVLLAATLAAGGLVWCAVLSSQEGVFSGPVSTVEDWPKEFRHYTVLQQAVREARAPLFVSRPILAGRKLLAVPELNCSPQVLLLAVVPLPAFLLLDTLLNYGAGCAGLLLLGRRYRLGGLPQAFLFALFFFNGHLVAHMAVGHSMWAAHFLLPFLVLGVLELVEGPRPSTPYVLALTLFAMLLRGGFHLFAWCVLLLLLLAAFNPSRLRTVARALAWSAGLGAVRLAPAVFLARRREQSFISGFPSPVELWHALVSLRDAAEPHRGGFFGQLGWWEYDTYLSPAGLLWLLVFGAVLAWRRAILPGRAERGLYGPLAVMAALSLGDSYLLLNRSPLPLLNAERVSSRLLLLPVLLLATLAAIRMQRVWDSERAAWPRWMRGLVTALAGATLAAVLAALLVHAWLWRVARLQQLLPPRRGLLNVELVEVPVPLAGADLAYVVVVAVAAVVSAASLFALWRRARRASSTAVDVTARSG